MISNKDFVTMKNNVAEIVGDASSTFLTKIGKWINRRYRDAMRRYSWKQIYNTYSFTTTANQATYPLPEDFSEAVYIWDDTNKKKLWESAEHGEQNDTSLTATPDYFTVKESTVKNQPTSASVLAFVSSSASDNTQTIFVRGYTGTVLVEETISMNGTTPVNTANSYTRVDQVSKSAVAVGTISATSNSGAVSVVTFSPKVLHARFRTLHLFYIPVGSVTLVVRYKRRILPLINDYDYPMVDLCDEIELGAESDAWRAKRQFSKAASMDSVFENEINKRIFQEEQNKDITISVTPYDREASV